MLMPFIQGFGTGGGLIVAIGAQNAFILSQGVQGNRPFLLALICFACDTVMILLGAGGIGTLIVQNSTLQNIAIWGGAIFLLVYGARAFQSAIRGNHLKTETKNIPGLWTLIAATLAVTLLNPHMYLDTVVLLGSISSQFGDARFIFAAGAIAASFLWFFSLSLGARLLAPYFKKEWTWRLLDTAVGTTMWVIAGNLILPVL